jgi:hypothetical protein
MIPNKIWTEFKTQKESVSVKIQPQSRNVFHQL